MKNLSMFQRLNLSSLLCSLVRQCLMLSAFYLWGCTNDPPIPGAPPTGTISLTASYVDWTEAGVLLTLPGQRPGHPFEMTFEGKPWKEGHYTGREMFFEVDSLFPKRQYVFVAYALDDGRRIDSSRLTIQTRDTTTHDYDFEFEYLGEEGSYVKDVLAIEHNDVWIAGNFRKFTPSSYITYNVGHWDGSTWTLYLVPDSLTSTIGNIIYRLKNNDLFFSSHARFYFDGKRWTQIVISESSISHGFYSIWQEEERKIHVLGAKGGWTVWDGVYRYGAYKNLNPPTSFDFKDISGSGSTAYAVAQENVMGTTDIVRYERGQFSLVIPEQERMKKRMEAVWFHPESDALYLAGRGIVSRIRNRWSLLDSLDGTWIAYNRIIRGTDRNNVWAGGDYFQLMHFNGYSWRSYMLRDPYYRIVALAVGENYVFAAGFGMTPNGIKAMVIRGYRRQ